MNSESSFENLDRPAFEATLVTEGKGRIAREILESLPDWFAIPEARENYTAHAEELPMFGVSGSDGAMIGFISLMLVSPQEVEVYVMGVKAESQGKGIGTQLIDAAERYAKEQGARFLSVKTLAPSREDPHYAATRAFYERAGFVPVRETDEWGPENPCLVMEKAVH